MRVQLSETTQRTMHDLGLLILRLGIGGFMLFSHGLGKAAKLGAGPVQFPDPLGVGAGASLVLAVFGEVVCAALLCVGLATRVSAIPFLITMLVAAFVVHADDPFGKKEFALLYAVPALTLALTGAGRFSIDHWWIRRRGG